MSGLGLVVSIRHSGISLGRW